MYIMKIRSVPTAKMRKKNCAKRNKTIGLFVHRVFIRLSCFIFLESSISTSAI